MIVKNEARCLARCLESVRGIVDEIVVADTGSTDGTQTIARQYGARVCDFAWRDDFAAARNYALEQTTGDWILVLDADEHASEALCAEIRDFVQGEPAVGRLRIVSDFRKNEQMRSQTFVSRLFPRGARFEGRIHEQLVSTLPRRNLRAELWHDGYLEGGKSDRNVKLLLGELERSPKSAYYQFQLGIEYVSLGRADKAFECLREAFDLAKGEEPFAPNVVVEFLYVLMELKRFEVGLEVIQRTGSRLDDFPDYHLVCGLFYMELVRSDVRKHIAYLPRVEACYKRCLELGESDRYKSVRGTGSFLAQYNLGVLYHVFDDEPGARRCFESAAQDGYAPAAQMLEKLKG